MRSAIARLAANEDLNFLLTNRLPRRLATDFIGWFSKIEQPLVARASIALWRLFSDVDLTDAAALRFPSMHACFTRSLRPGSRPVDADPDVLASPCDAIVGAYGMVAGDTVHQIKDAPYRLSELLGDAEASRAYEGGTYVTLRLTAGMYHHFHAPHDLTVEQVTYISGDCWNVNPIALKRVERLFCKNERAAIHCRLADGTPVLLVAVAAVLVASIRLTFLDTVQALRVGGPREIRLEARLSKGVDMGWFEHGSTIVMLTPPGFKLAERIDAGLRLRAGEALFRRS
ncbi:archaetidylserine decarboxylase [Sphingomonas crusticola]|uniref:archaetidylserine decarboxylase n=1 Tax=Sphingomonas crusticola TaxID=1697973 RepID=UPI001966F507|nr:archaetidylserine decarboxylase [Sphingomonas crusticola]